MERVNSGIEGLDNVLGGGIPKGSAVLITGTCGTGKSMLCLQYIVKGAENGEKGLYVSFEESREKLLEHGLQFGWEIEKLEKKGLIEFYVVETEDMGKTLEEVKKNVRKNGIQRLVFDSLTTMMEQGVVYRSEISKEMGRIFEKSGGLNFPSDTSNVTRKDVYYIVKEINRMGATSLLISEVAEKSTYLSRDTVSEFAVDGVIMLEINSFGGKPERLLSVKKMRGTPVDLRLSIVEFTNAGIRLK
ncbi:MAG: AAA family ATPase [Candidatus Altiarchaeota archaeon]|nr:AAA family ATPase [Candidatus Altiarchaeota archaeon]